MVARAGQRTARRKPPHGVAQLLDPLDFPGRVVEADGSARRIRSRGPDGGQTEIVVVERARGPQEGHRPPLARDRLETEGAFVEGDRAFEVADEEDDVIEALDGDHCLPTIAERCSRQKKEPPRGSVASWKPPAGRVGESPPL